ncbi:MAG: glycosyltransferase family 2 protein [Rhodocyclaceae bacterium]|jgi:GT2 family glycosyltransferase|nr:glycosyltransferase family 2 protein [Rhodocyclaceae bacterium]
MTVANSPKKVVTVLLNWNGKADTLACLDSLAAVTHPNHQVVVVDNGSTDGSVAAIKSACQDVLVLETGANLGYAGGNNVGIRWALEQGADFVFLLNNDTVVSPDIVDELVAAAASLPVHSVLGAKIYFYDEPTSLWFAGGTWDAQAADFDHIGFGCPDGKDYAFQREVDYVTGCALFASADTFRQVGLLDESFFLTYEETDWCYRARRMGYRCFFIPGARLWHKVSASFGGAQSPLVTYFMVRNRLLWARRHLEKRQFSLVRAKVLSSIRKIVLPPFSMPDSTYPIVKRLTWGCASWVKTLHRNLENANNLAVLYGFRDYLRGRLGNCPENVRVLARKGR